MPACRNILRNTFSREANTNGFFIRPSIHSFPFSLIWIYEMKY
jgi:hypothetical protein